MRIKYYEDERLCKHCDKFTQHKCIDSEHERDSSADYQECLVCGWWTLGISDKYLPPITVVTGCEHNA